MIFTNKVSVKNELRTAINSAYRMDEGKCLEDLLEHAKLPPEQVRNIERRARELILKLRGKHHRGSLDSFLLEFNLSNEEGVALMCLAEALLRVPDKQNIDRLIKDKLSLANWKSHKGHSESFFVNSTTWALMLTGKMLSPDSPRKHFMTPLKVFLGRASEPVIRRALGHAIKIMSRQFVMGQTIGEALQRAQSNEHKGYRYSYDMLGESAQSAEDADRYFKAYAHAIDAMGGLPVEPNTLSRPDISIKLSALHPRYEFFQRERVLSELIPKLFELVCHAKEMGISVTIDAEETECLDLSLDIFERLFSDPSFANWEGLGIAVQSYQKRAWFVIDWLAEQAKRYRRRIRLRLIKGAYWDSEIKRSQIQGLSGYPVFTRKLSTDVSFQACAKKIIAKRDLFYPQFATHNAYAVALILELMGEQKDYEFQCLHGMGQDLYDVIVPKDQLGVSCRIYAPVGNHEDLLPYLVRRLLENGANTSFVNRIVNSKTPIETLVADPVAQVAAMTAKPHPNIGLPQAIFSDRKNAKGIDLTNFDELSSLKIELDEMAQKAWRVAPIVGGFEHFNQGTSVYSPANKQQLIGKVAQASDNDIEKALRIAQSYADCWSCCAVGQRCQGLERGADLFEKHQAELIALTVLEGGKTITDAVAEVREAVDFCRYYAVLAKQIFSEPLSLQGVTGELNQMHFHGRGVLLCISPWNFPLAIFVGQIAASLASGNCVIAKPAEQTPLIAGVVIRLLHAAGIPDEALHLLPGRGEAVGAKLVADPRVQGVLFTGSTQTARLINQALAQRAGPIVPLIAETGGQNAMIVDSSALLEQVVADVILSAFGSAGQRCSALRVLYVQEDIAKELIAMLRGAMAEIMMGDPSLLATDVGPVIDEGAKAKLAQHIEEMQQKGKLIYQVTLPKCCQQGIFFPPTAIEIDKISDLKQEVFGPILHVIRYNRKHLDKVIDAINQTGYGLTLGIHSRINETVEYIRRRAHVGNCYVNRNMIGAVVGAQPFGGEGLSGTGPKAGGPNYLYRLSHERVLTINTTASGGNTALMSLSDE